MLTRREYDQIASALAIMDEANVTLEPADVLKMLKQWTEEEEVLVEPKDIKS
jgi:hypothetical protein